MRGCGGIKFLTVEKGRGGEGSSSTGRGEKNKKEEGGWERPHLCGCPGWIQSLIRFSLHCISLLQNTTLFNHSILLEISL